MTSRTRLAISHVREVGLAHHAHVRRAGNEVEVDGLEVHEQRVGPHVVGAPRFAVELRGVVRRGREEGAVEDHVAADLAKPACVQLAYQLPQALVGEPGVAAAPEDQVARERPAAHRARHENIGLEGVRGTQEIESRESGDQLDRGGGIEGLRRLMSDEALAACHRLDDGAHGGLGHSGPGERVADGVGKLARRRARER